MPKYQDPTAVLDAKLDLVAANCDQMHLVDTYVAGDSYAVVIAASLCAVAISGVDWTKAAHTGNGRKATLAAKSGTASATAAAGDRHIALVDSVNSVVYHVTDETTDQAITLGNPIDFPVIEIRENQPV